MNPRHHTDGGVHHPEDALRQAFEAQASRVAASPDALDVIRTRIVRRRRGWNLSLAWIAGSATATAAVVLIVVTSCLPNTPPPQPPGVTGAPTAPPTVTPGVAGRLPVYFVGGGADTPLLYREFRGSAVPGEALTARIVEAVRVMLTEAPLDPDYSSPWPAGAAVRGVTLDGPVAVVDLAGAGVNDTTTPAMARIAVQQLVYTVTAVAADQGTQLAGVRVLLDGAARATLWAGAPLAGTLTRGTAADTQAPVWLISPQNNDTVNASFDVHLAASVDGGNLVLRVREGSLIRSETSVTLGTGAPLRAEAHVPLTLPPGTYTLEAFTVSPATGRPQSMDNHTIIVR